MGARSSVAAARGRFGSGGRTRTPNDWTRTSCVTDYTTPEWADGHDSNWTRRRAHGVRPLGRGLPVEVVEPALADQPTDGDRAGLSEQGRQAGGTRSGRHLRMQA